MFRFALTSLCLLGITFCPSVASAVKSGELYTAASYGYGRFEARIKFAAGDGVVSAYFLWKDGSELDGMFWNELDFEKIGADCRMLTNALYGNPESNHSQTHTVAADLCGDYHVFAYEWTPESITWLVDGVQLRRETGDAAMAFAENAPAGMQFRFNLWPGDASFGGNFNPNILPVHQYVDWVQYSSYSDGAFTLAWREDFEADTVPTGWATADWASPKNLSTHDPGNVNFINGFAVFSLTADDAVGPAGADPGDPGEPGGSGGAPAGGAGGASSAGVGAGPGAGAGGASSVGGGSSGSPAAGSAGTSPVAGTGPVGTAGSSSAGAPSGSGGSGQPAAGGTGNGSSGAGSPGSSTGGLLPSAGTTATGSGGTPEPGSGGSSGSESAPGDDAGCGCRVAGGGSGNALGALGLALFAALARRRARSRR